MPFWALAIFVFQVKAVLKTAGKYSKAQKQIEKDKKTLQAFVDENLKGKLKRDMDADIYKYPGFVVMPNCPLPNVKPAIGVFKEDCKNVEDKDCTVLWNAEIKLIRLRKCSNNSYTYTHFF